MNRIDRTLCRIAQNSTTPPALCGAPPAASRPHAFSTLLPSGKVLVAGGTIDGLTVLASAELYDDDVIFANGFEP
jgi:hypothetical protein